VCFTVNCSVLIKTGKQHRDQSLGFETRTCHACTPTLSLPVVLHFCGLSCLIWKLGWWWLPWSADAGRNETSECVVLRQHVVQSRSPHTKDLGGTSEPQDSKSYSFHLCHGSSTLGNYVSMPSRLQSFNAD
jgi:hypothetical protein